MRLVPDQIRTRSQSCCGVRQKGAAEAVELKVTRCTAASRGRRPRQPLFDAAGRAIATASAASRSSRAKAARFRSSSSFRGSSSAPVLLFGVGLPDENAHAPNEWLSEENFYKGMRAMAALWEELGNSGAGRIRPPPPHATLVPVPRTPSPHLSQFSAPARAPVLRTASCVVRTTRPMSAGELAASSVAARATPLAARTIAVIRQPSCVRRSIAAPRLRACVCEADERLRRDVLPRFELRLRDEAIDSARPDLQRRVPRRDREHVSPERAPSLQFRLLRPPRRRRRWRGVAPRTVRRRRPDPSSCPSSDDARVARRDQRRRRLAERDQRQQLGLGPGRLRVALERQTLGRSSVPPMRTRMFTAPRVATLTWYSPVTCNVGFRSGPPTRTSPSRGESGIAW